MFNASTDSFLCTLGKYILLTGIIYYLYSIQYRKDKQKEESVETFDC